MVLFMVVWMIIKTTLVVKILNQMMLEFLILADHHKTITIDDLGYDLAWSILNNFTKLDLLSDDDLVILKADLVNSMIIGLTKTDEPEPEGEECSAINSTKVH